MNSFNLLTILSDTGLMELSFLGFLKIIFLIIFIIINIILLYCNYKDKKYSTKCKSESQLKSSISEWKSLRNVAKEFIVAVGLVSSFITINNEFFKKPEKAKEADAIIVEEKAPIASAYSAIIPEKSERVANNFANKLHMPSISHKLEEITQTKSKRSALIKAIEERNVKWEEDGNVEHLNKNKLDEVKIQGLEIAEKRHQSELEQNILTGKKFSELVSKEEDEEKYLALINEDIKKSSIFDLDIEKIWKELKKLDLEELWKKLNFLDLEELWIIFESFNGITKLVITMMFSNYFILSCISGLALNLYGNKLLDKFQLENRYPKLAIFIKYRRKVSQYYIISNIIFIILVCILNLIFGISVLSIMYL